MGQTARGGGNVNMRSIEVRLSQVEARHSRGESDWERRQRECAERTMRQTVEQYGDVMIESAAADGEIETMEDLFEWADEYDALPVKPTMEETLKEYGEIFDDT